MKAGLPLITIFLFLLNGVYCPRPTRPLTAQDMKGLSNLSLNNLRGHQQKMMTHHQYEVDRFKQKAKTYNPFSYLHNTRKAAKHKAEYKKHESNLKLADEHLELVNTATAAPKATLAARNAQEATMGSEKRLLRRAKSF